MDEYVKSKWIAALRSGDYKQHRGRSNNRFRSEKVTARCCLNVGAHVIVGDDADRMDTAHSRRVLNINDCSHLIRMNDTQKKTFSEIADWIEANLETED